LISACKQKKELKIHVLPLQDRKILIDFEIFVELLSFNRENYFFLERKWEIST